MILSVLGFFLWGWFLVSVPCGQRNAWYDFNFLEFVEAFFVSYHVVYLWKCSTVFEKSVYFASLGGKALYISVKSIQSMALFKGRKSLLIFCLEDLSIFDRGVLISPSISVAVYIFFEVFQDFPYIFGCSYIGYIYIYLLLSSWWILPLSTMKWPSGSLFMVLVLTSILSDMSIATPDFFSCPFAWKICFQPFTFSLCRSFVLRWVTVGSLCVGHVFLSVPLFCVFWLGPLIHLHLRLLLIGTYSLPFYFLHTCVPLSHSFSSFS